MSVPKLDWRTAEVTDAKLKVDLDGELPHGWSETFQRTAALLGSGDWDEVRLKKHSVLVIGLMPGGEEKLRHHLEGIVQEANATHGAGEREGDEHEQAEEEGDGAEDESTPDAEMTERIVTEAVESGASPREVEANEAGGGRNVPPLPPSEPFSTDTVEGHDADMNRP